MFCTRLFPSTIYLKYVRFGCAYNICELIFLTLLSLVTLCFLFQHVSTIFYILFPFLIPFHCLVPQNLLSLLLRFPDCMDATFDLANIGALIHKYFCDYKYDYNNRYLKDLTIMTETQQTKDKCKLLSCSSCFV